MPDALVHTCVRYGNASIPFRSMCDACVRDPREASLARALSFLCDALEECELTEDEMHAEPGTFYIRLLAAKSSLEDALQRGVGHGATLLARPPAASLTPSSNPHHTPDPPGN